MTIGSPACHSRVNGCAHQSAGEDPVEGPLQRLRGHLPGVLAVGEVAVGAVDVAKGRGLDDQQFQRTDLRVRHRAPSAELRPAHQLRNAPLRKPPLPKPPLRKPPLREAAVAEPPPLGSRRCGSRRRRRCGRPGSRRTPTRFLRGWAATLRPGGRHARRGRPAWRSGRPCRRPGRSGRGRRCPRVATQPARRRNNSRRVNPLMCRSPKEEEEDVLAIVGSLAAAAMGG